MENQKLNLPDIGFTLKPSPRPPKKRIRKGKSLVWVNEKIKGNTGGLQLPLFEGKGQQTNI
ncbi:unnamed protein product [marine sediment metagenome]|uniref:Uncharacterized protein n=1 Tax=marine sediment metagenome TaxID=412755 RepID=X1K746_9ZZZZ